MPAERSSALFEAVVRAVAPGLRIMGSGGRLVLVSFFGG